VAGAKTREVAPTEMPTPSTGVAATSVLRDRKLRPKNQDGHHENSSSKP
jgi:hypothetical protein